MYEKRYDEDGAARDAVVIDSKQPQLNRVEQALRAAIDGYVTLPRLVVSYPGAEGGVELSEDLELSHRAFDGHIRAGMVAGRPVTGLAAYQQMRDAQPGNARLATRYGADS